MVAQGALPGLGRLAAHDEPEERRLAGAVGAEHGDALALLDLEAGVVEQDPPAVPVPEPVDLEDLLAGVVGVREREGALLGHERLLDPLARQAEPLELLLGRGGAARLRAPGQPVDEVPLPRHLLVPLLPRDPLRRGALRLLRDELRIVALVARRDAELGLDDLGAEPVEELAVVRDDDHGHVAGALAQVGLEPLDRAQVEVVGRLVEQQQVGVLQQDLPQAHTHLPAARVATPRGGRCRRGRTRARASSRRPSCRGARRRGRRRPRSAPGARRGARPSGPCRRRRQSPRLHRRRCSPPWPQAPSGPPPCAAARPAGPSTRT